MAHSRRHAAGAVPTLAGARVAGASIAAVAALTVLAATTLAVRVARVLVTPNLNRVDDVIIHAVDLAAGTVTISGPDAAAPGRFGLWFSGDSGYARIGRVLGVTAGPELVTRELLDVDGSGIDGSGVNGTGRDSRDLDSSDLDSSDLDSSDLDGADLESARRGRLSAWFHRHPSGLGLAFENVGVPTPLGAAPAWIIPADVGPGEGNGAAPWAILVHGRGGSRSETLRAVPAFHAAGYTCLLVSWRNDGEAPRSEDGRYGLGDSEWLDVEAAIRFAVNRGSRDVVLAGWSMGGAIVLQAADRAADRGVIRGIMLDSPVVGWGPTLQFQGALLRVPPRVQAAAVRMLGSRGPHRLAGLDAPIDFARLDFVARAAELSHPVLLLHSDDDGYVPATASIALAAARPDTVTFSRWTLARHTRLWNVDSERYTREITEWLATLE